jgi:hypothetical protein
MTSFRLCVPLFLIVFVSQVHAQHFALSRLFYPNATLRADYMTNANMGNNQRYGLSRTSFNALIPLRSEVDVAFSLRKKFDLRARHFLMLANASQINPTLNGTTNETFFTPQPFFWGGGARMRILGLHTQIAYGTVLIFNQKLRFVPIFGINKRLSKDWRVSALLPFRADVNYKVNQWFNIDMIGAFDGYSGGFQQITSVEKSLRRSNYQHVKLSLAANAHLLGVFNVSLEAGLGTFRQLRTFNSARENLGTQNPGIAPFVGASVRYISSKAKLSSQFTKKLGLGETGINW